MACPFGIEFKKGQYAFTSGALLAFSALFSAIRIGGSNSRVDQEIITIVGQRTAVKLFSMGTELGPQVDEQFDIRWLDMRLPPGMAPLS